MIFPLPASFLPSLSSVTLVGSRTNKRRSGGKIREATDLFPYMCRQQTCLRNIGRHTLRALTTSMLSTIVVRQTDWVHLVFFATISAQTPAIPDHTKVEWDPKKGFTILYKTKYDFYDLPTCSAIVNGRKYISVYIITRLSKCLGFYILKRQSHQIE